MTCQQDCKNYLYISTVQRTNSFNKYKPFLIYFGCPWYFQNLCDPLEVETSEVLFSSLTWVTSITMMQIVNNDPPNISRKGVVLQITQNV